MAPSIELSPGFPLPLSDYLPLLQKLRSEVGTSIRLAHSLGCLEALAGESQLPLVLMAPSIPGPRHGRSLVRTALTVLARTPASAALSVRLRNQTYSRYGATAPAGPPLSLAAAAARLRPTRRGERTPRGRIMVLCSPADRRHTDQQEFARLLGAPVHWVDGGHLFPITNPAATAAVITGAFRG